MRSSPAIRFSTGAGASLGSGFAALQPWDERLKKGRSKTVILAELSEKFGQIQDGVVFPFSLPPIVGLGQSAGSEMWLEDKAGIGLTRLNDVAVEMIRESSSEPQLSSLTSTFRAAAPTIFADVDRTKALSLRVPLQSVFDTLQAYLGSSYVNDFNEFGRTWHVTVQAEAKYRAHTDDIRRLQVRNQEGQMVPIGTLAKVHYATGPLRIDRYNMFPAIRVVGQAAPGVSSGQVMNSHGASWRTQTSLPGPGTNGPVWHFSRRRSAARCTWCLPWR